MASMDEGKNEIITWVKNNFPRGATCLDVGACDGKWFNLLGDYLTMDAVEIFEPNIEQHHLRDKYRTVCCTDIADIPYRWYDLIIFGDVIEHMTVEKAQRVLEYARSRCKDMIVAVPFGYKQDAQYGNPYEKHIQDDLTDDLFMNRYPGFRMLRRASINYAYYIKQENIPSESVPKFSVIVPTHNGADRLHSSLASVLKQTFTDYELIVVCDACDDNSAEVAESFGAHVITTNFRRDGLARNAGLDAAKGTWILFLDDDDYFLHEYVFELLAGNVGRNGEDVFDFAFIWKTLGFMLPSREKMFVMVWARAWKRSFIGSNRFNDQPYGSDTEFFDRMIRNNPDAKIMYWDMPMYYYNYLREGSLSWMEKRKTMLDIIITHYDEPWDVGKPFFDMLAHQRIADIGKLNIVLVQDGNEHALDWTNLLSAYTYNVKVITIDHKGTPAARNAGLKHAQSDWVMFFDFDDMFCDLCSVQMIMSLLPTDECDIIWSRHVMEMIWRKGRPYLQTVTVPNFINTVGKLYRRQFLSDKHITFDESLPFTYEYAFNAVCLTETPPFRIKELTTEFYPFLKAYRKNSLHSNAQYYKNIGKELFYTNIAIANNLRERGYQDEHKKFVGKAVAYAYYSIYNPDTNDYPCVDDETVRVFLKTNRDSILAITPTDMEVLLDEAQSNMMSFIQRLYNECGNLEYYIKNNGIAFPDWLAQIDADTLPAQETPGNENGATHSAPALSHDPRVVVYCGTKNVYPDMVTSCKSLLYNTPVDKVYFLTEDDTFPLELPDIVETINVKNQTFFNPDGPNFDNSWTYMCMMRAAYPGMFPDIPRVLSLDIDIVIDDNVSDLWNYDITDYYLAGVPETQRQKTEADPLYINFGVVMMNLDKLRADNKQQQIIDMLNARKIDCPEQSAFNEACAYHILDLPPDFNSTVYSHITGKAQKERILHYAGQTFWKHYSNVKRYSDLSWEQVMRKQNELKGATNHAK